MPHIGIWCTNGLAHAGCAMQELSSKVAAGSPAQISFLHQVSRGGGGGWNKQLDRLLHRRSQRGS